VVTNINGRFWGNFANERWPFANGIVIVSPANARIAGPANVLPTAAKPVAFKNWRRVIAVRLSVLSSDMPKNFSHHRSKSEALLLISK
jgi:hypothetical protein